MTQLFKLTIVFLFIVITTSWLAPALAAPFVVTDALAPGVTHCGVFIDAQPKITVAVTAQGASNICRFDAANIASGAHRVEMTAIINDPLWGVQESLRSLPLDFTRPAAPAAPPGLRLEP